jgi:hypothetical protein
MKLDNSESHFDQEAGLGYTSAGRQRRRGRSIDEDRRFTQKLMESDWIKN